MRLGRPRPRSRYVWGILLRERRLAPLQARLDARLLALESLRDRIRHLQREIAALEMKLTGSQRGELDRWRRM
jgi:hypothetical protein